MNSSKIDSLFDFFREIDREKLIVRQNYITGAERKETDAEHAWHAALMCILLSEYSNSSIDVLKTVTMILIHDIVEIDAGDTYAYDEEGKKTQRERELKAAERIFGLLPKEKGEYLHMLREEFEQGETSEAKFAHVMDNIQPLTLNDLTDGKSWREHNVSLSQILRRNEQTPNGSETLWDYALNKLILPNVDKGNIIDDTESVQ